MRKISDGLVCQFVWKSTDCLGSKGTDRKQRWTEVLELVWFQQPDRMVSLFRIMVCRPKWLKRKRKNPEVFTVQFRSPVVQK